MAPLNILRLEINGGPATVDQLAYPVIVNYGHFTAMQVRSRAVRGLGLHLRRLDSATRELFGVGLDGGLVREYIRHALGARIPDASVRVGVFREDSDEPPSIMVVLRPPGQPPSESTIGNIGFFDGDAVIWPSALSLEGITMQLVSTALAERGVPSRRKTIRVADLPSFRSVFLTNSFGVAPVRQVDDQILSLDPGFTRTVVGAYESVPWDQI